MTRPRLAIAGLTACSGCQLTLLNCELELLQILERFEVVWFPMAQTPPCPAPGAVPPAPTMNRAGSAGSAPAPASSAQAASAAAAGQPLLDRPNLSEGGSRGASGETAELWDVALVEGAVSTPEDLTTLFRLRNASRLLVAFGTCALHGGVAAMNNAYTARADLLAAVYGAAGSEVVSFPPAPFKNFVTVDFAITGCPPEKDDLLALLGALLAGTLPPFPSYPVCTECRSRENLCLLLERNELCLGPIIQGGCNARCPATGIPCEGCRGPVVEANVAQELELLLQRDFDRKEIERRMSRFTPGWNYGQRR